MKLLQFGAEEESVELKKGAGMVSHNLLWIRNKAEHRLSTKCVRRWYWRGGGVWCWKISEGERGEKYNGTQRAETRKAPL
jgi:hypothetical protein